MKYFLLLFLVASTQLLNGQTDRIKVKQILQDYIQGSSYNNRELIKSAFAENATLYLTGKTGFKRFTPNEYANFFKEENKGKFNGRAGKILAIEVIEDIATAKVEICIQKTNTVYVDLFLLKRIQQNWKIISKTATRIPVK